MAEAEGPTARLRRTFQYPNDSDSDSLPDAMDEQEQDHVIARLAADNAARDARFRNFLVALPLVAALPYLPLLARPRAALLALLALSSLAASAFLLLRLPPHVTGIAPLDAWARGESSIEPVAGRRSQRRPQQPVLGLMQTTASPLERYLPYMNAGLAGLLVLMGLATGRASASFGWVGVGNLPAIVYLVVLASKVVMASVDPERELSALKYGYKGA